MNVIENDVRALVDKELTAANERFPQFRSQHEGYAVILEEFDEAKEQLEAAELFWTICGTASGTTAQRNCRQKV